MLKNLLPLRYHPMTKIKSSVFLVLILLLMSIGTTTTALAETTIRIGSKPFTESNILAEILAQTIERIQQQREQEMGQKAIPVAKKYNLGGTGIIYRSLQEGKIDIYPEYTGTISQAILKLPSGSYSWDDIQKRLDQIGLVMSQSLGFNNTYAIAVGREVADKYQLQTLSDLSNVTHLKAAFEPEFTNREDGLGALIATYDLKFERQLVMKHALLYQAILNQEADVIDIYSTDSKISKLNLQILKDDKKFFPSYWGIFLTTQKFIKKYPELWSLINTSLGSKITEEIIIRLNGEVEIDKYTYESVAKNYLNKNTVKISQYSLYQEKIWHYIAQHLQLVLIPLFASIVVGVLLGILGAWHKVTAQFILSGMGLLQTIPSLALLCLLIPLVGIGRPAAYFAIFLYGILPITRNTYLGLTSVHRELLDYACSIGLNRWEQLKFIQLPLAMKSILAGIKTSAVINVGTATLAAFIGGGGLGGHHRSGVNP